MNAPAPFDTRLARLYAAMDRAGVGAYLCDHAEMLAWLTGYSVSETFYHAAVIPRDGDPAWILRRLDELPCRKWTWIGRVIAYADHEDAHGVVIGITDRPPWKGGYQLPYIASSSATASCSARVTVPATV